MANRGSHSPRWYGIPLRVLLATVIGTLLCFAISLLLGILGTVVVSALRGVHPDMSTAYRFIAIPTALAAGSVILILSAVLEFRHYREAKTLSAIERMG